MATLVVEDQDPVSQGPDAAGEVAEGSVAELRGLKRQRGRRASVFTPLCTKIDGLLARHAEPGELEKRLGRWI